MVCVCLYKVQCVRNEISSIQANTAANDPMKTLLNRIFSNKHVLENLSFCQFLLAPYIPRSLCCVCVQFSHCEYITSVEVGIGSNIGILIIVIFEVKNFTDRGNHEILKYMYNTRNHCQLA